MQQLTDQGWQKVLELSQRFGISTEAVMSMLQAVLNGNGTMAQFNHPELGGGGQWMQGGMTMVGDMFNHGLKSKVDRLCGELSNLLLQRPFVPSAPPSPSAQNTLHNHGGQMQQQGGYNQGNSGTKSVFASGNWWPAELGMPNGSGSQNNMRYAYFNNAHRLVTDINGHVTVYDTLDHQIGGVSQQQSGDASLTFGSQYGTIYVSNLPVISIDGQLQNKQSTALKQQADSGPMSNSSSTAFEADIFSKIERLADLKQKNIISEQEFNAKKSELLGRL